MNCTVQLPCWSGTYSNHAVPSATNEFMGPITSFVPSGLVNVTVYPVCARLAPGAGMLHKLTSKVWPTPIGLGLKLRKILPSIVTSGVTPEGKGPPVMLPVAPCVSACTCSVAVVKHDIRNTMVKVIASFGFRFNFDVFPISFYSVGRFFHCCCF